MASCYWKAIDTYQHANGLFKDAKYLEVRMRGSIQKNGDGMEHNKGSQLQRIIGSPREITI